MKCQAILVLVAIAVSIVAPPSLLLSTGINGQTAIGTLDICHSATPALSSNGDMPCMNECSGDPQPLLQQEVSEIENSSISPLLIAFQDEHPPKISI